MFLFTPIRRSVLAERQRLGRDRLPRVHARPVEPARSDAGGHRRREPAERDGRGLERLVRARLPRRAGAGHRHERDGRRAQDRRVRRRRRRPDPHESRWTARSARPARRARGPRARARAATRYGDMGHVSGRLRGPRRRRDLGADAVGPARGARLERRPRGSSRAAMELSPTNPSFLDVRNAILQADLVDRRHATSRSGRFAHRGMGYFAGPSTATTRSRSRTSALPPTSKPNGKLNGKVVDATPLPVVGASVPSAATRPASPTTSRGSRTERPLRRQERPGRHLSEGLRDGARLRPRRAADGRDPRRRGQDRLEGQAPLGVALRRRIDRRVHRTELQAAVRARQRDRRLAGAAGAATRTSTRG